MWRRDLTREAGQGGGVGGRGALEGVNWREAGQGGGLRGRGGSEGVNWRETGQGGGGGQG